MPPHRFDLPADALKATGNRLAVEVTNLGSNRLRWNDRTGVVWKYFTNINMVGMDYKPLDASKYDVLPSGLLGPVRFGSLQGK